MKLINMSDFIKQCFLDIETDLELRQLTRQTLQKHKSRLLQRLK